MQPLNRRSFLAGSVGMLTLGSGAAASSLDSRAVAKQAGATTICPQYKYMESNGRHYYYAYVCPRPPGGTVGLISDEDIPCPQPCTVGGAPNPLCKPPTLFKAKGEMGPKWNSPSKSHDVRPNVQKAGIEKYADDNFFPEKFEKPGEVEIVSSERCRIIVKSAERMVKVALLLITPPATLKIESRQSLLVGVGQELPPDVKPTLMKEDPYKTVSIVDAGYCVLVHPSGAWYHILLKK